jgi:predicted helicase
MQIGTPDDLAQYLAHTAHALVAVITTILNDEGQRGILYTQFVAFRQTLLPTLAPAEFADMYAQTLVYGLFAARVTTPDTSSFTRHTLTHALPPIPLLQQLFSYVASPELDTRLASILDDCSRLLERTDMAAVLQDFGKPTKQEDPVVHFYETFLSAYAPKTREMRGVYYTPEPVVGYIVRSVDYLLQTHLHKPLGLADGETMILDPSTGTATFLHAVVQHISTTLHGMGMERTGNQYVPDKLLPRLFGFELLMAPYTIAHLKLSMLLQQLGYQFGSGERLGIYLTNALSDAPSGQQSLPFAQCIAEEGKAADTVKHTKPVMVVLGNPPYSYQSVNTGEWIGQLVRDYYTVDGKPLGERNPKGLQDDYVKFLRFGQYRITQTGEGILAFINNHGYLDNLTFRGMRESLLYAFDTIYVMNLHGNSRKKERAPDGTPDENVFDIQQGVAIGMFVKTGKSDGTEPATVYYADLWGRREAKYTALLAQDVTSTNWQPLEPVSPWYLFVPQDTALLPEYERGWKVTTAFPVYSAGIITARDSLVIQHDKQTMWEVITTFANTATEAARQLFHLPADTRDWKVHLAQADVCQSGPTRDHLRPITYRPFDNRWTYYTGKERGIQSRPRKAVMQHMHQNIGLITVRQVAEGVFTHAFVTEHLVACRVTLSNKGYGHLFPLYLSPNNHNGRRPNLAAAFITTIEQRLGLTFIPDGTGDLTTTVGPEDIFHYTYALLHTPTYRSRYAEFLKIDFPHIAITSDRTLFVTLAQYGATLVDLHLLRLPGSSGVGGAGGATILVKPNEYGVTQYDVTLGTVEQVTYDAQRGQVMLGGGRSFGGIEAAVWEMQIGGYQPLHKWLKDRKGRTLSFDDTLHYMRMVVALGETLRVMGELDAVGAVPLG